MKILRKLFLTTFCLFLFLPPVVTSSPIISNLARFSPVEASNGMVVTTEPLATQIGVDVLKRGGNAVDAAVTIGFVLAVTYPRAGNLGGGGFMLFYAAKTSQIVALDYREVAPMRAYPDMFLDCEDHVDTNLSRFSHQAAGVPGTVAGLALALQKYGTLSLAEALAPAIRFAEEGFRVTSALSRDLKANEHFSQWPASQAIFLKPDGSFYEVGDIWIQKDLANTLKLIAQQGIEAFYQGDIAKLIVKDMKAHNGLISRADLAAYQPTIRQPVHGSYRGDYEVYSMSPPSSGGVHILQMLNMLEADNLSELGHNSAATIHLMTEAMKRAYADRSKYLGDPDFGPLPINGLISKAYAAQLRTKFDLTKATASQTIAPAIPPGYESPETTHYSVIDKEGNAVSNTYTLNFSFGSGIVVPGTGFLLNNQMDDFSAKPGEPNAYGLIGSQANAIKPQKRMLSSMSPTIVLKQGKPFLITGSPGGSRIITTTLQVILNVIEHKMNIQEAVNAIRIHHQWLPDELRIEKGLNLDTINLLKNKGHTLAIKPAMGAASSILINQETGIYYGASDPRRTGLALGY
jgi:gamma-glutamyltranspeptidase/glutathione hydrolase